MLWTTLAFIALTVVAAIWHVRRSSGSDAPGCPRCDATVPAGASRCPACAAPLQAWEVVQAAEASGEDAAEGGGQPHAIVRADVCVGCSTCVDACPEEGALRMQAKLAVVDLQKCVGHGDCASACPVSAIVVTTGGSVQRVEVPRVDVQFETNVPGMYIVGELGGRGLIKNAVNEGRLAVEHVARSLQETLRRSDRVDDAVYDVAIVGSGPAGLSAGLEAKSQGLRYILLEQGSVADSIRKYPRHKLLLAEPVSVPLYGQLWVSDATKEALLTAWEAIIESTGLQIQTDSRVVHVGLRQRLFDLEVNDQHILAHRVVLAMGRRGTPRRLGIPGEESETVFYDIVEMEAFRERRVVVVGGGDSAIESALGLCNQKGCQVTLSYRGDGFRRAKPRNLEKLEAAQAANRLRVLLGSQLTAIHPDRVDIDIDGVAHQLPNDNVIVRIGGEAPTTFLEKVGVQMVAKDIPLVGSEV